MGKNGNEPWKKRIMRILIGTTFLLAVAFALRPVTAKADFGDFSGDTDYGGGSWDSDGWDSRTPSAASAKHASGMF